MKPRRSAHGGRQHLAPTQHAARAARRRGWVTTALYPVGAACTRSRPVSTAWTASAATSWVGTCAVVYDDVLVGTTSSSAPARTEVRLRFGVEHLEGDQEPERPGRSAHEPAAVPGHGIERDLGQVGEVGEERAVGHVLAERHPVHLLEDTDDAALGTPGHDLVAERRGAAPAR